MCASEIYMYYGILYVTYIYNISQSLFLSLAQRKLYNFIRYCNNACVRGWVLFYVTGTFCCIKVSKTMHPQNKLACLPALNTSLSINLSFLWMAFSLSYCSGLFCLFRALWWGSVGFLLSVFMYEWGVRVVLISAMFLVLPKTYVSLKRGLFVILLQQCIIQCVKYYSIYRFDLVSSNGA